MASKAKAPTKKSSAKKAKTKASTAPEEKAGATTIDATANPLGPIDREKQGDVNETPIGAQLPVQPESNKIDDGDDTETVAALSVTSKSASFWRAGIKFSQSVPTLLLPEDMDEDTLSAILGEPELIVEEEMVSVDGTAQTAS